MQRDVGIALSFSLSVRFDQSDLRRFRDAFHGDFIRVARQHFHRQAVRCLPALQPPTRRAFPSWENTAFDGMMIAFGILSMTTSMLPFIDGTQSGFRLRQSSRSRGMFGGRPFPCHHRHRR